MSTSISRALDTVTRYRVHLVSALAGATLLALVSFVDGLIFKLRLDAKKRARKAVDAEEAHAIHTWHHIAYCPIRNPADGICRDCGLIDSGDRARLPRRPSTYRTS